MLSVVSASVPEWKQVLRTNFTRVGELAAFLELDDVQKQVLWTQPRFSLNLPYRLAKKISKGTLDDPILRQFLPTRSEQVDVDGFATDPVGDGACRKSDKLIKKYEGRALLVCTSACAMHCRYCFRQHFDYVASDKLFVEELAIISGDASIQEVILSGGDPLSLDDRVLENLLVRLSQIPHVKRVRFHTRFPIGIPERIDDHFREMLASIPLQFWFVVHVNHPRELDSDVLSALQSLQKLGIPVLNQFVLLKDVNDTLDVLVELSTLLADHGIMNYYMHQLDRVQGAAHFEVSEQRGRELSEQLANKLSGYAAPKYVKEVAGMAAKTPIVF